MLLYHCKKNTYHEIDRKIKRNIVDDVYKHLNAIIIHGNYSSIISMQGKHIEQLYSKNGNVHVQYPNTKIKVRI